MLVDVSDHGFEDGGIELSLHHLAADLFGRWHEYAQVNQVVVTRRNFDGLPVTQESQFQILHAGLLRVLRGVCLREQHSVGKIDVHAGG